MGQLEKRFRAGLFRFVFLQRPNLPNIGVVQEIRSANLNSANQQKHAQRPNRQKYSHNSEREFPIATQRRDDFSETKQNQQARAEVAEKDVNGSR